MEDNLVKCKCDLSFPEEEFVKHFQKCETFRKTFKTFDSQLGELLKLYSEPKENLIIIKVLLKQYIVVLDKKIKSSSSRNCSSTEIKKVKPLEEYEGNNNINPFNYKNDHGEMNDKEMSIDPFNENYEKPPSKKLKLMETEITEFCQLCNSPNILYLDCLHQICSDCFINYAMKDLPNMKCISCSTPIMEDLKKQILGKEEYDRLDFQFTIGSIGNVIDCPQCKEKIQFEKGNIDYNIKNEKNEVLNKESAEHYASYRCRCPACKIDFCTGCQAIPYHIGQTCESFVKFVASKRCRFDNTVITKNNKGPSDDVCSNDECKQAFKTSCKKVLKCGHKCFGCHSETICPPCLEPSCPDYVNIFDQNSDSYCNICFTEGLGSAPVVLLSCNHFVHYRCIETRLAKKWIGPKITFNHCLCPQCNNWVDCPTVPSINSMIIDNRNLFNTICKMAIERLKFEGLNKDPKLTDPNSKWYKDELGYALNRISYYLCYECKKPYFAGLRECGEGPVINNNNPNREYDPKDLICGAHANLAGVAGISECKIHGKEFIEYKCKFCCNVSSWFCWGTTHFCEDCHSRQCKGEYVSKYSKDKLPKCDKSKCQVKVDHPPNGEEFALGCIVCRNNNMNMKNF